MRTRFTRYSLVDRLLGLIERQRPSDRFVMRILFFTIIGTGIYLLLSLNNSYGVLTPTKGGDLVEGIVGMPRFVNPALAITRADQDTVALLYSGLLKIDQYGNLVPDLAESVALSEDGQSYDIVMKKNKAFHDGRAITAKDVAFTIDLIKNPDLKSPIRGNWHEVTVELLNEYELKVTLKEAYSPFIENFTFGIMPEHIWGNLPLEQLPFSQYNTEPIGSGPFKINAVTRDNSGLINSYILGPSTNNIEANLNKIELRYFQNEEILSKAFTEKNINSTAYLTPENLKQMDLNNIQIISEPLPRTFGIFFNQNRSPALRDKSVRQALDISIDRNRLIEEVLGGYGVPTNQPILLTDNELESEDTDLTNFPTSSLDIARDILTKANWKQNASGFWEKEIDKSIETLSITIRTSNSVIYEKTASLVADDWRKLGVEVQIEQYEQTGLVQSVIRTRDFQALLFGLDMNRSQDLYPFWHSSQKDDPGLNIAQYTNLSVDQLLEKAQNSRDDIEKRQILYEINEIISTETPAIFLFVPNIVYVVDKNIIVAPLEKIGKPSDRFMNTIDWYAKTETLWPIFHKNN